MSTVILKLNKYNHVLFIYINSDSFIFYKMTQDYSYNSLMPYNYNPNFVRSHLLHISEKLLTLSLIIYIVHHADSWNQSSTVLKHHGSLEEDVTKRPHQGNLFFRVTTLLILSIEIGWLYFHIKLEKKNRLALIDTQQLPLLLTALERWS